VFTFSSPPATFSPAPTALSWRIHGFSRIFFDLNQVASFFLRTSFPEMPLLVFPPVSNDPDRASPGPRLFFGWHFLVFFSGVPFFPMNFLTASRLLHFLSILTLAILPLPLLVSVFAPPLMTFFDNLLPLPSVSFGRCCRDHSISHLRGVSFGFPFFFLAFLVVLFLSPRVSF